MNTNRVLLLEYKILSGQEVPKFRVHLKREIRPKRDFVDTSFHASCAFGHNPTLGLALPHSWEMADTDMNRWDDGL